MSTYQNHLLVATKSQGLESLFYIRQPDATISEQMQRLSAAVQRGNATSVLGSVGT